jgi:hypothetical protein
MRNGDRARLHPFNLTLVIRKCQSAAIGASADRAISTAARLASADKIGKVATRNQPISHKK